MSFDTFHAMLLSGSTVRASEKHSFLVMRHHKEENEKSFATELDSCGGVPERLNGTVSKTVVGAIPPRVRISAPPPFAP